MEKKKPAKSIARNLGISIIVGWWYKEKKKWPYIYIYIYVVSFPIICSSWRNETWSHDPRTRDDNKCILLLYIIWHCNLSLGVYRYCLFCTEILERLFYHLNATHETLLGARHLEIPMCNSITVTNNKTLHIFI